MNLMVAYKCIQHGMILQDEIRTVDDMNYCHCGFRVHPFIDYRSMMQMIVEVSEERALKHIGIEIETIENE